MQQAGNQGNTLHKVEQQGSNTKTSPVSGSKGFICDAEASVST